VEPGHSDAALRCTLLSAELIGQMGEGLETLFTAEREAWSGGVTSYRLFSNRSLLIRLRNTVIRTLARCQIPAPAARPIQP